MLHDYNLRRTTEGGAPVGRRSPELYTEAQTHSHQGETGLRMAAGPQGAGDLDGNEQHAIHMGPLMPAADALQRRPSSDMAMQARREAPMMRDTVAGGETGWAGALTSCDRQGASAATACAVLGVPSHDTFDTYRHWHPNPARWLVL